MIDLHLHLDGSLPPALLPKLAEIEGICLPSKEERELIPFLTVGRNCRSLNEYLEKFTLPVSCMQSVSSLFEAGKGLAEELDKEGILYAEIRFAPQLHTQKGLSQQQAVQAVLSGLKQAEKAGKIRTNVILCCMRGADNMQENLETVHTAAEFLGKGVCAADLAGAEGLFPTRDFSDVFALARKLSIPFTIHAGEAAGAESIKEALSFGAARIGHGTRCLEDAELMKELKEKQIVLEQCVTSNYQTKAVSEDEVHPILSLLRQGIAVTVNTDNMTVSGTSIAEEFSRLYDMGMTKEEEKQLLCNSVFGAFLPEKEKKKLYQRMKEHLDKK